MEATPKTIVVPQAGLIEERPLKKSYLWHSPTEAQPETSRAKLRSFRKSVEHVTVHLILIVCWLKMQEEPSFVARLKAYVIALRKFSGNPLPVSDPNWSTCTVRRKWYSMLGLNWYPNQQLGMRHDFIGKRGVVPLDGGEVCYGLSCYYLGACT